MIARIVVPWLLLALVAPGAAWSQGIGVYFTLVNTYIYDKGPRDGKRTLVRPRQAFAVLDVTSDGQEVPWYLIVYPAESARIAGTGWTPAAPHELLAAGEETVSVFSAIPAQNGRGFTMIKVPANKVELLNETQSVAPFAQVAWQKVRYQFDAPLRAWARGTAGIYRPAKSATFLSRVYGELLTRNVDKDEQTRLISGVVRIGDTVREVRWAMGDPLRSQTESAGDARRQIWQYPELTVTFENEVVKQIN